MRSKWLLLFFVIPACAAVVTDVRFKISAGDLSSAEAIAEDYRAANGANSEYTAAVAWLEWRSLNRPDSEAGPFIGAIALFTLSYLGLGISLFPYVVPHRLTLWQAASNPSAQVFLLIGTLFLLPVILMYTAWSYWVFRGKVRADTGYH